MNKIIKSISNISLIKYSWAILRKHRILKSHKKVALYCNALINNYFEGKIEKNTIKAKKEGLSNKIIWQYWGQGFNTNDLPEMVQFCLASVQKYKGDYQVIRLDDKNIEEYIDLPSYVWEKKNNEIFSRTFFSDLLRIVLLKAYGGVWVDSTILLTKPLPEKYSKLDYFVYQRSDNELLKKYWEDTYAFYWGWESQFRVRMFSSLFFATKSASIITVLCDLLLSYWKTENTLIDYFFLQILYNELIIGKLKQNQCPIESDTYPHLLQTKINNGYEPMSYKDIFAMTGIHKMSYKENNTLVKLKSILGAQQSN